ncbi:hypothetical protein KP509_13G062600 [Ceratopteris richardii]|nr:hypothetical protein KP509_13G062600 [Ceratopteris richardii]
MSIIIQCAWRRKLVDFRIKKWNRAALDIQRVYRGHVARMSFWMKQVEATIQKRMSFINAKATLIQKIYRGFYCRKYVHSFYDRKHFIAAALDAGRGMKRNVQEYNLGMREKEQDATIKIVRSCIRSFWLTNHHLISTKSRNGLFYSPYIAVLKGLNDVEDRIVETRKEEERIKAKSEATQKAPMTRKPNRGRRRRRRDGSVTWAVDVTSFVTTEGPYGPTAYERRRTEEKAARLLDVGQQSFRNVVRSRWKPSDVLVNGCTMRMQSEWRRKEILRALEHRKKSTMYLRVAPRPFFISPPKQRRFTCGPVPPLGS